MRLSIAYRTSCTEVALHVIGVYTKSYRPTVQGSVRDERTKRCTRIIDCTCFAMTRIALRHA